MSFSKIYILHCYHIYSTLPLLVFMSLQLIPLFFPICFSSKVLYLNFLCDQINYIPVVYRWRFCFVLFFQDKRQLSCGCSIKKQSLPFQAMANLNGGCGVVSPLHFILENCQVHHYAGDHSCSDFNGATAMAPWEK